MIMKWLPMVFFGLAALCWMEAFIRSLRKEYPLAVYGIVEGCFFLLLILAMRALTD